MKFTYFNPVKTYFERECVKNHREIFSSCGKRAMIVTGRHSAKECGALKDVTEVLEAECITWIIFDQIENNPSLESVSKAAELARKEQTDFVIGIGGGSPIDASKAIAVLAANQDMQTEDLFQNSFSDTLPVIAVPTTAGTGSEMTQYSVLLNHAKETKLSFGNEQTFPEYALLDSKYTFSLPYEFSISTAVDAFTHVFEGFLAKRSTPLTEQLSMEGIRVFGECMPKLLQGDYTEEVRDKLMYVSMLGGLVISMTGVTIAHGMGYCYTYFKGIPHGRANGLLMKCYIPFVYPAAADKMDKAMALLHCTGTEEFLTKLEQMIGKAPALTQEEVEKYTHLSLIQKGSIANTPVLAEEDTIYQLWTEMKQ